MCVCKYVYMITKHAGQVDSTLTQLTNVLVYHCGRMETIELNDEYFYAGRNAESRRIMNQTFERELEELVNFDLVRIPALLSDVLVSRGISRDPFAWMEDSIRKSPPYENPKPSPTWGYLDYERDAVMQLHNMQKTLNESVSYFTALGVDRLLQRE